MAKRRKLNPSEMEAIAKGATRFANVGRTEPEAEKLFRQLEQESDLIGMPRDQFVARLAHYYCELNVVHPFRDGNGRAQRLLFEVISINAGYALRWEPIGRAEWLDANIAAYNCQLQSLTDLLDRALTSIWLVHQNHKKITKRKTARRRQKVQLCDGCAGGPAETRMDRAFARVGLRLHVGPSAFGNALGNSLADSMKPQVMENPYSIGGKTTSGAEALATGRSGNHLAEFDTRYLSALPAADVAPVSVAPSAEDDYDTFLDTSLARDLEKNGGKVGYGMSGQVNDTTRLSSNPRSFLVALQRRVVSSLAPSSLASILICWRYIQRFC
jgi:fido (protein-threonine AMPylation protein)